ncbi:lytic transglycosylase domain-containing protein [Staphylococcus aureus]|uniref:lytic transglycosylase domain-containing protein n=1 Tax=Staphylococcaceae TaxID=90964 RepID=UPI0004524DE1|nr:MULTISPECIES: lytic transglycosylase domain-containing protein [Staphylococcaceae]EZT88914.1 hypothetical protein U922_02293 [Staphylococcus aureus 11S01420]EZV01520.1 hypothetical protein U921_02479 [Staphylococcus aureus 11S01415]MDU9350453.1 CHAP domain-containing protein [Staphylococcus ureilyticus]MDV0249041.1 CHAP domain-containing protein [Staphylococcus aureus]WEK91823.1 CHAP domain-containing protein [Staphylococcus aureus]
MKPEDLVGNKTKAIVAISIVLIFLFVLIVGSMAKKAEEEQEKSDEYSVNGGTVQNPRSEYADNEVPKEFKSLYENIAKKYGIDWQLLAGIHRVETAFSSNVAKSSAGAIGHTQFMKCTWAGWSNAGCAGGLGESNISKDIYTDPKKIKEAGGEGVDGNGNGKADPMEISDSLSATAKKLKKDGANESPQKAIRTYNHSDQYVSDVMKHYNAYKDNVKWVKAGIKDPDKLGKTQGGTSGGGDIEDFKGDLPKPDKSKYGVTYPYGQCTWYAYERRKELNLPVETSFGNGGDWGSNAKAQGYKVNHEPKAGALASFPHGTFGSPAEYGHIAVIEKVKKDGSFIVSESNVKGLGVISYREFKAKDAETLNIIHGK